MPKKRTHLLLEPEQYQALTQIARREGRSLSDITREIVQEGIQQRQHMYASEKKKLLQALERTRKVREDILEDRGGVPLDLNISILIDGLREERDGRTLRHSD
jgi:hypothetical protein